MVFGGGPQCCACSKTVYMSDELRLDSKIYHQNCAHCLICKKQVTVSTFQEHDGCIYCINCATKIDSQVGHAHTQVRQDTTNRQVDSSYSSNVGSARNANFPSTNSTSNNKCLRCNKAVYHAEKIVAIGRDWHKSCLTCKICNKRLDSTTLTNKEMEVFCKACYAKEFGPKGYGYGGGAGTLHLTK